MEKKVSNKLLTEGMLLLCEDIFSFDKKSGLINYFSGDPPLRIQYTNMNVLYCEVSTIVFILYFTFLFKI